MITLKVRDTLQVTEEQEKNWQVAQRINRETRANPQSPYTGKYVGVLHQQVVAVGNTLDKVCDQLDALGDDDQGVAIEANADYDRKVMFWRMP